MDGDEAHKKANKDKRRSKSKRLSNRQAVETVSQPPSPHVAFENANSSLLVSPEQASDSAALDVIEPQSPTSHNVVQENAELVENTVIAAEDLKDGSEVFLLRIPASISVHDLHAKEVMVPLGGAVPGKIAETALELHREEDFCHQGMFVLGARRGRVSAVPVAASFVVQEQLGTVEASEEIVDMELLDLPGTPVPNLRDCTDSLEIDSEKKRKKSRKRRRGELNGFEGAPMVVESSKADDGTSTSIIGLDESSQTRKRKKGKRKRQT
jgi:hypothetical protein